MLVLCVKAKHGIPGCEQDQHKVFIWKGIEFDEEEASNEVVSVPAFIERVMELYWGCKKPEDQFNIQIVNEMFNDESDEFTSYFS
mmetsp:Transcript_1920/g.2731  ORF Transcript_1920/g.2731 Transcript_1920/m.2731 type:complete len:85 (+) Transcript_1920:3348-3602(+)